MKHDAEGRLVFSTLDKLRILFWFVSEQEIQDAYLREVSDAQLKEAVKAAMEKKDGGKMSNPAYVRRMESEYLHHNKEVLRDWAAGIALIAFLITLWVTFHN